jgi:hypothetical protein
MPRTPSVGSNIPSPARADTNLQIRGNWIWNGPADHPLGIEQAALAADVLAGNAINTVRPVLVDPAHGNYSLAPGVVSPVASAGLPPVLPPPPALLPPLKATFRAVAATTARAVTSITVTFNRTVRGVTLDDFVLFRGRAVASLAGARITTSDQITYTITTIRGTHLAGGYTLRLKAAGTGIFDAANEALAAQAVVSWRMTRTVPPARFVVAAARR